eukprot:CAMPEP_0182857894 /NCGR_PEP_ID=MMETSP0034_2-20130328/3328_1 /TAXON_ID=156128 /ORGANISM="Nephroselmis pyriformis, Strain CCMP717" /LENGTH=55 /DNA_ID=CAMNT_0024989197 /DNA_START=15 /DNA_END=179 /DNA_ORIENTATION=+
MSPASLPRIPSVTSGAWAGGAGSGEGFQGKALKGIPAEALLGVCIEGIEGIPAEA